MGGTWLPTGFWLPDFHWQQLALLVVMGVLTEMSDDRRAYILFLIGAYLLISA